MWKCKEVSGAKKQPKKIGKCKFFRSFFIAASESESKRGELAYI